MAHKPQSSCVLFVFGCMLFQTGCGNKNDQMPALQLGGHTMGTSYNLQLNTLPAEFDSAALEEQIADTLERIEQRMSTYRADSELSRFNRSTSVDWVRTSVELCVVIEKALSISQLTGAFDITVGPLVNLWGFGPLAKPAKPPSDESISAALAKTGFRKLHSDCSVPAIRKEASDVYVDLSALAKGYAVDQLAELLLAHNIDNYLVEIGGELRLSGLNANGKQWSIAIEKPDDYESVVQNVVHLTNAAVATSGDYRNFYEYAEQRYSHTIDPRTGRPVTHNTAAVAVISNRAILADAMATALLSLGAEEGMRLAEQEGIAAYFILRNGRDFESRASTAFIAATSVH